VVYRFHAVQLGNDILTQVRQRVIRETQGRHGRTTDPAWANRRRLLTVDAEQRDYLLRATHDWLARQEEDHVLRQLIASLGVV